ncbi:putative phosphoglycerate mutase family protein [Botrytis cinerea BcDW1]|nr:putative phosphoglycerate mutase family protein [Botrytis cinerea BcDW1]
MTRTIRTAILFFESAIDRGVKVQALDLLQNWDSSPNGIGMDKEYLHKHFGEQVDFDKVEEGWNDKSSGKWAPKSQEGKIAALKLALNNLRSTTNIVEVVIVSHGSVLRELTNRGGWRSGEVRSYLIDDKGKPHLSLDKSGLEFYRSHPLNQDMISKLDRVHSAPLDPSILAETSTYKPSESSEKASAVKIKVVIKTTAKDVSKNAKEEILKASKRCETHEDVLFKLFQEDFPPTKVKGGNIEGVGSRPIILSKPGPMTTQASKIQTAIGRISDHGIATKTSLKLA